jgi:hypothetical protein
MKNPSIKTLKKKLKKICHEFIRKRDCQSVVNGGRGGRCCTCGKPLKWNDAQANAGHFVAVGTATQGTEFDERNIHLQCVYCNNWGEGKKPEYSLFLIEKYGPGIVEELVKQSKWSLVKFVYEKGGDFLHSLAIVEDTKSALAYLIRYYDAKLKEL